MSKDIFQVSVFLGRGANYKNVLLNSYISRWTVNDWQATQKLLCKYYPSIVYHLA